ncbi:MAG: 23S rRNA (adenine(2503)-C(2))-methyltransferase RlmN, partial [Planctomycetales bacterium]|nr:23S rRNA (adenine(2503)-C(2))-methyltransferase RlmN [Planctomycetales bacterium]
YFAPQVLTEVHRSVSAVDGSTKLVLETFDGLKLETVLLPAKTGRITVCVSSQIGCAAGCPFCATARMGWQRNVSDAEMLDQVLLAARIARATGKRLRNVVFMGMGEPLDNESHLFATLDLLLDGQFFDLPAKRVTVSTVGVPEAMCRLLDRYPGINLAVSLHSAVPELRAKLVPWSRCWDWQAFRETLAEVARKHHAGKQGSLMIEHILIAGVNDRDSDAWALVDFLQGMPAHVNLIPYNAVPHIRDWQATSRPDRDAFANILRSAGIFTTIRCSLGDDVQAACGQLALQS